MVALWVLLFPGYEPNRGGHLIDGGRIADTILL